MIRIDLHSRMRQIHQIVIRYFTYLVLNKRKPDNKQAFVDPASKDNLSDLKMLVKKRLPFEREEVTSP